MPEVYKISSDDQDGDAIKQAAVVLRKGKLVAFPTETVYGLGANALDEKAVARIFAAKGRPANNPLIVHVASVEQAKQLVADWPQEAEQLAAAFWPGPLTFVLPKRDIVPDIVTAAAATVAVRSPAHPVAMALLSAAQLPIAAPSANRSCEVSPTLAEHVVKSLGDAVDVVLDGGPTTAGLESTVLDLTVKPPRLLRPGAILPSQIEAIIGPIQRSPALKPSPETTLPSPGLLARHYAPRAPMTLRPADAPLDTSTIAKDEKIGWLRLNAAVAGATASSIIIVQMPKEPTAYAARLYAALHQLDDLRVTQILVDLPPPEEAWLAIHDRLRRGATAC